jgi:hypothetical protein
MTAILSERMTTVGVIGCGYWRPNLLHNFADNKLAELAGFAISIRVASTRRLGFKAPDLPVTELLSERALSRLMYAELTVEPQATIAAAARD